MKNDYVLFIFSFSHKAVSSQGSIQWSNDLILDATKYTRYLFSIIDRNHKGTVTFDVSFVTFHLLGSRLVCIGLCPHSIGSLSRNNRRKTTMDFSFL